MATDFPQSGDDEPISLGNSRFDVFDHSYARNLKPHIINHINVITNIIYYVVK